MGGRPGERLMGRLGVPVSDDTILRQLKRDANLAHRNSRVRNVGSGNATSIAISTPKGFANFVKKAALPKRADGKYEAPAADYMSRVTVAAREFSIDVCVRPVGKTSRQAMQWVYERAQPRQAPLAATA
jgi:hypothetical protein